MALCRCRGFRCGEVSLGQRVELLAVSCFGGAAFVHYKSPVRPLIYGHPNRALLQRPALTQIVEAAGGK